MSGLHDQRTEAMAFSTLQDLTGPSWRVAGHERWPCSTLQRAQTCSYGLLSADYPSSSPPTAPGVGSRAGTRSWRHAPRGRPCSSKHDCTLSRSAGSRNMLPKGGMILNLPFWVLVAQLCHELAGNIHLLLDRE